MRQAFADRKPLHVMAMLINATLLPSMDPTSLCVGRRLGELIEYMEITLAVHLTYHTTLLQQIVGDLSTDWFSVVVEHDLQVLPLLRILATRSALG